MKVTDVVFRDDLYPRFEPDQATIQKYANSVEYLPPIIINQDGILIDGFHRWKAHQLAGEDEIKAETVKTQSEKELKQLAYQYNSHHGLQLSNAEKKRFAQEMIGQIDSKDIAAILSVNRKTVDRWTESQRQAIQEEQNRQIVELYLRAWNTQQSIADILGIPRRTIADKIEKFGENGQMSESAKDFTPLIYNIWNTKSGNETEHFGSFPTVFMENLLYYHTEPLDIVFDPFAGNGTTVDVCKQWYRRYYCSDIQVKPGREKDIIEHDITTGLPDNLPKPDMVFLDPPYWKQAEGMYTDKKTDLSNVDLGIFNAEMNNLLQSLADKKVQKIAIVIQPTQYKNGFDVIDHIFDFHGMLSHAYNIEMRYILPYSTQQYNAQMVEKAKDEKQALILNRDLVVWSLK